MPLKVSYEGEGRVGESNHLTRREEGRILVFDAMMLKGKNREEKILKWRKEGGETFFGRYPKEKWDAFVADVRKRGVQDPILIVKDHGKEPLIYEGNHRVRAAKQAGLRYVPVEIRYFGHGERDGLVSPSSVRASVSAATYDLAKLLPRRREAYGPAHTVPLSMLDTLELRSGMSPGRVDLVREAREAGKRIDPIEVDVYPSGVLSIGDGNHRLKDARDAKLPTIEVKFRRLDSENLWHHWNTARDQGLVPPMPITDRESRKYNDLIYNMMLEEHRSSASTDDLRRPVLLDIMQALRRAPMDLRTLRKATGLNQSALRSFVTRLLFLGAVKPQAGRYALTSKGQAAIAASALSAAQELLAVEIFTDESGQFWGNAGAGGLFYAESTGRVLVQKRSSMVNEPNTWGVWGGAIDPGENPDKALKREVEEESGYRGKYELERVWTFKKGNFQYHNYLVIVPDEFEPRHSWESSGHEWVDIDDIPKPIHFGLKSALPHFKRAVQKRTRKAVAVALRAAAEVLGRDVGRVIPKKFYVVVPLYSGHDRDVKRVKDVARGILDGIQGISDKAEIIMHWYGAGRNAIIAMDAKKLMQMNKLSRVQYTNPHYLASDGLFSLYRLWDKDPTDKWGSEGVAGNFLEYASAGASKSGHNKEVDAVRSALRDGKDKLERVQRLKELSQMLPEPDDLEQVLQPLGLGEYEIESTLKGADKLSQYADDIIDRNDDTILNYSSAALSNMVEDSAKWAQSVDRNYLKYEQDALDEADWYTDRGTFPNAKEVVAVALDALKAFRVAADSFAGIERAREKSRKEANHLYELQTLGRERGTYGRIFGQYLHKNRDKFKGIRSFAQHLRTAMLTSKDVNQYKKERLEAVPDSAWMTYVDNGLKNVGRIFKDEGEWLVKDQKLKVPRGSLLYVSDPLPSDVRRKYERGTLTDAERDFVHKYNIDGAEKIDRLIKEYGFDKHYKVKRVDDKKMDQAKSKFWTRRDEKLMKGQQ